MAKIINNEINARVIFGKIEIETSIGILEYSYQTGYEEDTNYHLETNLNNKLGLQYRHLSDDELDEIDDLIMTEITK